jgi:hypothetical protein
MEYTLKIQDQSIPWYVTFSDKVIVSIDDGQQVYTPDSPQWQQAKRYVEDLILTKLWGIV